LEITDKGNPALAFIREMQVTGHHVAALTALALYKPAAGGMRTVFETALYYTYFRTHKVELATLVRDSEFFISKKEIIDYHKQHSRNFSTLQQSFGLVQQIDRWYSKVSAIIHGQVPGGWTHHLSLEKTSHVPAVLPQVVETFVTGEELIHRLFLCTVAQELWNGFSSTSKKYLLVGLPGGLKTALALDAA
jgi:hypothetical protein